MKLFKQLLNKVTIASTRIGNEQARRVLLTYSDRALADMGFSRKLLESGISAWPWRAKEEQEKTVPLSVKHLNDAHVISELRKYSDSDLRDLGLSRGSIPEAVKHGRAEIETKEDCKVA